jgi:hypothetical protein
MFATEVNTTFTKYHNYRQNKVTVFMHSLHREHKTMARLSMAIQVPSCFITHISEGQSMKFAIHELY